MEAENGNGSIEERWKQDKEEKKRSRCPEEERLTKTRAGYGQDWGFIAKAGGRN